MRTKWLFLTFCAALAMLPGPAAPAWAAGGPADCGRLAAHECELLHWRPPIVVKPLQSAGPLPFVYARVIRPNTPVYAHPADPGFGIAPKRALGAGLIYVSVSGETHYRGNDFVQINPGEFVAAADLLPVDASTFSGRYFAAPPAAPFGWVIEGVHVRAAPAATPDFGLPYVGRYQPITISNVQHEGVWEWYEISPGHWVEQRRLARVLPQPAATGLSGRWIEVNLYEQTAAAFENGRLVYATLTSSGLQAWSTRTGLYKVWAKQRAGRMTGAYRADGSDYYFLEDVPWILYFDGDISLHGAYWHDSFGYRRSHGCVNLAPADARWFFNWATLGTPVYVYTSAPAN